MSVWNLPTEAVEDQCSPFDIAEEMCNELAETSGERLFARITAYDGAYTSHGSAIASVIGERVLSSMTSDFDVQSIMGNNASEGSARDVLVYELYITSRNTPKYKYRILFMYYNIPVFPVGFTIQEDIAKELHVDSEGTTVNTVTELKDLLLKIFNCNTVKDVLLNLLSINPNI